MVLHCHWKVRGREVYVRKVCLIKCGLLVKRTLLHRLDVLRVEGLKLVADVTR